MKREQRRGKHSNDSNRKVLSKRVGKIGRDKIYFKINLFNRQTSIVFLIVHFNL